MVTTAPYADKAHVAETPEDREKVLSGLPVFFRLAAGVASRIRYGALRFVLPDGRELLFSGAHEPDAQGTILVRDFRFARRAVRPSPTCSCAGRRTRARARTGRGSPRQSSRAWL